MEIIYKNVNELIEYENNPRDNSAAVTKVAESIEEFGFINPISITTENVIISGHTRLAAAKTLGIDKVPCIVHEMTDEEVRLARIIDNKSSEYSNWDVLKLQTELDAISNVNMTFFKTECRDIRSRMSNLIMCFGKNEIPVTESEYLRLKSIFDSYVKRENTYLGFLTYLLEGKYVQN